MSKPKTTRKKQTPFDVQSLKIQKNVPKPLYPKLKNSKWKFLLLSMKVGDSVAVKYKTPEERKYKRSILLGAIQNFKNYANSKMKFSVIALDDKKEVRLWRDK